MLHSLRLESIVWLEKKTFLSLGLNDDAVYQCSDWCLLVLFFKLIICKWRHIFTRKWKKIEGLVECFDAVNDRLDYKVAKANKVPDSLLECTVNFNLSCHHMEVPLFVSLANPRKKIFFFLITSWKGTPDLERSGQNIQAHLVFSLIISKKNFGMR